MCCPKAICPYCGQYYSGWSLAQRDYCDCGRKLMVFWPYDVILSFVKAFDGHREIFKRKEPRG